MRYRLYQYIAYTMSNSSETGTGWKAPPIGAPCWVEIPAEDVKACKVRCDFSQICSSSHMANREDRRHSIRNYFHRGRSDPQQNSTWKTRLQDGLFLGIPVSYQVSCCSISESCTNLMQGPPDWGGGIVQMRPGYKTSGQKNLTGPIIYHFVDSIEEVGWLFPKCHAILSWFVQLAWSALKLT